MSVRMMGKVWELDLPQPLKLLALALADVADDEGGNIYPSKAFIAWKVGAHPKTIQRQLATLEELGIVEVVRRRGHRLPSGQWTRLLRLHPERGDKLLPLPGREGARGVKRGSASEQKGERSYVPLSVRDPLEIRDDLDLENLPEPEPGESRWEQIVRLTESWGKH